MVFQNKERKAGKEEVGEGGRRKKRKVILNQVNLGIAEFNKLSFLVTGLPRIFNMLLCTASLQDGRE